jgi:hypothetical protein
MNWGSRHTDTGFLSDSKKYNNFDETFDCNDVKLPDYVKESIDSDCKLIRNTKGTDVYTIEQKNGNFVVRQPPYKAGRKTNKRRKINKKRKTNKRRKTNKKRKH